MYPHEPQGRPDDALEGFLKTFLGLGAFIGGCSLLTLALQPRGSGEYYLTLCNIGIGTLLMLAVVGFMWWRRKV